MRTPGNGIGVVIHEIAERAKALARLEAELALAELRGKIASLGAGGALLAAAGVLGLFALGFLLATGVAGLATFLDTWLALLLVGVVLLISTVGVAVAGLSLVKRGMPPIPDGAVKEARLTAEALKGNGHV